MKSLIRPLPQPLKKAAKQALMRIRRHRYLIILGHMRSGSTLLCHLLNTNPQILGYGECHRPYRSKRDFKDLVYLQSQYHQGVPVMQRYVFDKLLHDRYLPDPALLRGEQIKPLFLVREAEPSLKSMLIRFRPKWGWDEQACLSYYTRRLDQLLRYAEVLPPDAALLLTFENLLRNTDQVFDDLQRFLGLPQGFSQRYEVDKSIGKDGVGDSSGHIRQGRIVRDRASKPVQLSDAVVQAAREVHTHTLTRLAEKFPVAGRRATHAAVSG